jgi:hypothetical protein
MDTAPTDSSQATPTFGELLRRYRLAASISQERLAERAGLSVQALSPTVAVRYDILKAELIIVNFRMSYRAGPNPVLSPR